MTIGIEWNSGYVIRNELQKSPLVLMLRYVIDREITCKKAFSAHGSSIVDVETIHAFLKAGFKTCKILHWAFKLLI
jgi:hypothetical protein